MSEKNKFLGLTYDPETEKIEVLKLWIDSLDFERRHVLDEKALPIASKYRDHEVVKKYASHWPIWAVDFEGNALVGDDLDAIEHVDYIAYCMDDKYIEQDESDDDHDEQNRAVEDEESYFLGSGGCWE